MYANPVIQLLDLYTKYKIKLIKEIQFLSIYSINHTVRMIDAR